MKKRKGKKKKRSRSLSSHDRQPVKGTADGQANRDIHNQKWPNIARPPPTTDCSDTARRPSVPKIQPSYDRSPERHRNSQSGHHLPPPWGYGATSRFSTHLSFGVGRSNTVYPILPAPPTHSSNSAPHYQRTFLTRHSVNSERDAAKRRQRLEVSEKFAQPGQRRSLNSCVINYPIGSFGINRR